LKCFVRLFLGLSLIGLTGDSSYTFPLTPSYSSSLLLFIICGAYICCYDCECDTPPPAFIYYCDEAMLLLTVAREVLLSFLIMPSMIHECLIASEAENLSSGSSSKHLLIKSRNKRSVQGTASSSFLLSGILRIPNYSSSIKNGE